MAHPKLATAVNRSLLAISSLALVAGPLAVAGSAQSLEGVTDSTGKVVEDLTCEQARKTEDDALIAEFCPADEPKAEESDADPVEDVTKEVERTAKETQETVESVVSPDEPTDDPEDDGGESAPTDNVIPPAGGGGGDGDGGSGGGGGKDDGKGGSGRQVSSAGENPRGIEAGPNNNSSSNAGGRPADSAGYSTGGWGGGYRSQSALTLQPFAAPLVSVPPVYEFPQIAEQLLTGDEPVAAGEPVIAPDGTVITPSTTAVNSYSNGATGTPADPTGWLAATATGLIMLVGAAHALNGGRTPRRVVEA